MKVIKKHWLKVVSLALVIVISVFVFSVCFKKVNDFKVNLEQQKDLEIYSIWHIETFEGGGKSRIDYLKKIARDIEKQNPNILFMIKQINPQSLDSELEISKPDIISFGYGVGSSILPILNSFNTTYNVRDELIESGSFNKKLCAIPYIVSGYSIFTHSNESNIFHCGQTGFTKPETIYNELNLTLTENETQYDAYKDFVYNKKVKLLGTARDLFRINNLNNIGRTNAMIKPIDSYTDLIQYIGITKTDEVTKLFIEKTLSSEYQQTLTDYSLFSSLYNKLYYDGIYNDMEEAITSAEIPNVFND